MSDIVDLDVFVPLPVTIKFEGQELTVQPPRTVDFVQLSFLMEELRNASSKPDSIIDDLLKRLDERIYIIIPELKDKPLTKAQRDVIISILLNMAVPEAIKAMREKGVTREAPKKNEQS